MNIQEKHEVVVKELIKCAAMTILDKINAMPFPDQASREAWAHAHPEVLTKWMYELLEYTTTEEFRTRLTSEIAKH